MSSLLIRKHELHTGVENAWKRNGSGAKTFEYATCGVDSMNLQHYILWFREFLHQNPWTNVVKPSIDLRMSVMQFVLRSIPLSHYD
ncbi:hypothetical protein GCM10025859_64910 [Alicyclobacillus fastidiosus]|nr:hypothetical protein GCM10025859_64910 [Alicyclobacillus fastidiosus]